MKRKMIAVVVGSLFLVSGLALAGAAWGHKSDRMRQMLTWKVDDAMDSINATDSQRKTANALKDQLFDEGMKVAQTREQVRGELMRQWKSDHPDANVVHAEVDRMIDAVRVFAHKVADAGLKMHQELTPEQREKLSQRAEEHRARWAH